MRRSQALAEVVAAALEPVRPSGGPGPGTLYVVECRTPKGTVCYVGSTAKSAQERFAQHKAGPGHGSFAKSNGMVRQHGVRLLPTPQHLRAMTRDASWRVEEQAMTALRRAGLAVRGASR